MLLNLMEERGMNQRQLSNAADIPTTTISGWINSSRLPDYHALIKLACCFNVSTDYLLGLEDDFGVKKYTAPTITQKSITFEENQLLNNYRTLPNDLKHLVERYVADVTRIYHDEVETKNIKKLY